jgi:hypothetical protein
MMFKHTCVHGLEEIACASVFDSRVDYVTRGIHGSSKHSTGILGGVRNEPIDGLV